MKTVEQIKEELNSKIPQDAITERDSGFGGTLSYLKGWYVIDRLNQVFGQGNWCYQIGALTKTFEGLVGDRQYVSYTATVNLTLCFGERTVVFSDVGFGDGQDKHNPGKAHEHATKEAVTDAIKRCAKSLGMSMGLALYDKTREFVEAGNTESALKAASKSAPKADLKEPFQLSKETLIESFKVLKAQNKITAEDFSTNFVKTNGAEKVAELSDVNAAKALNQLRAKYPELSKQ